MHEDSGPGMHQHRGDSSQGKNCLQSFLPTSNLICNKFFMCFLFQNPVAHVWSDRMLIKRKFCNVCRKRMEDVMGLSCEGKMNKQTLSTGSY